MAVNTNKRIAVKWIRDKAKRAYEKQDCCYICDSKTELELHHLNSITHLLNYWAKQRGYDISTDESILAVRDEFIEEHYSELYTQVFTLCNPHHVKLHGVFGKSPLPSSVPKQAKWIELQKAKKGSPETIKTTASYGSFFSEFL
jgi:hypothetical protein